MVQYKRALLWTHIHTSIITTYNNNNDPLTMLASKLNFLQHKGPSFLFFLVILSSVQVTHNHLIPQ